MKESSDMSEPENVELNEERRWFWDGRSRYGESERDGGVGTILDDDDEDEDEAVVVALGWRSSWSASLRVSVKDIILVSHPFRLCAALLSRTIAMAVQ